MATNSELLARREASVPRGLVHATDIFIDHAENAELWDVEGKRYIDFAGGIAALNTGHRHPKVMAAIRRQIEKTTHVAVQVTPYESYVALAEKLNRIAPSKGPNKTIFFTTGSEANENAIKIARAATARTAVISFAGGFHGRTMGVLALTGKVDPYKKGFGPFPGEVYHIPYPNRFHGIEPADSLRALELVFKADVEATRVAAVIIEPVLGEGGFYIAPAEFLRDLRRVCDQHGILLVVDEVQTGFGRTGKMFAIEHSGVAPDMVTMAKSLGGGMPLSAVTGRAEIMDKVQPGALGGTFGGNPISCAAGLAVLEVIEEEGLLARSAAIGERIVKRMSDLAATNRFPCIGEVRGLGGMVGIELVQDRVSREPAAKLTKRWAERCHQNGLVVLTCGIYSNVVRVLVPLTASDAIVGEGLDILEHSLDEVIASE